MQFIPNYLPYPSVRYPIYARNGMVCASSPQAAAAGLEAMKKGGNAMDAAVATAAALTVCEPTANGIGSDALPSSGWKRRRSSTASMPAVSPPGTSPLTP